MLGLFYLPNLKKVYLASFFLILLPPFYVGFPLLNINTLAKVLWLIIFLWIIKKRDYVSKVKPLVALFLFFFFTQSASVVSAFEISAFLRQYEDLFFTAIFFLVSYTLIKKPTDIRNIIKILLIAGALNLFLQTLIFFAPDLFLRAGGSILHPEYLEIIKLNIARGRIYFESYDEILIPFLVLFLTGLKNKKGALSFVYLLGITAFSFLSNFRTRFLMFAFSLSSSVFLFFNKAKKVMLLLLGIPVVIFVLNSFLSGSLGFTVFDRFLFESEREDVATVEGRIEKWQKSIEMGLSSPFIGVGLGNYYDYLDPSMKTQINLFEQKRKEFEFAVYDPHGLFFKIFAETGFLGLFSFLALLAYFVKQDASSLLGKEKFSKALAISFWTLFVYSWANPSFTTKYQALFWLLRILSEKTKEFYSPRILES